MSPPGRQQRSWDRNVIRTSQLASSFDEDGYRQRDVFNDIMSNIVVIDINIMISMERINSFDYCRVIDNWREGECLIEFTNCKNNGNGKRLRNDCFFRKLSWNL